MYLAYQSKRQNQRETETKIKKNNYSKKLKKRKQTHTLKNLPYASTPTF